MIMDNQYNDKYTTVLWKRKVTTCVTLQNLINIHLDHLPIYNMENKSLLDPNRNNNIPQFTVGYICLPYLRIHKTSRVEVKKYNVYLIFPTNDEVHQVTYNSSNNCVIAIMMLY